MKNILVPVGSSESAIGTLQYAINLAAEMDANVYVISVFQEVSKVGGLTKVNTIIKEDTKDLMEGVIAKVDTKDVTVVSHPIKGDVVDAVERFNGHIPVDLMVISPRSNSISEEVYLGKMSGKLVKNTNFPILVAPEGGKFVRPNSILMAFKNGSFKKKRTLDPLKQLVKHFDTKLHLLHVETPNSTDDMKRISGKLMKISSSNTQAENATTFQAVLEHHQSINPDIICVVRRKRGFFKKLFEKNIILKKEFHTSKPLLILQVQD